MPDKAVFGFKATATTCGYIFLFAILIWDPANIITFTGRSTSEYDDGAKAAGCALIAALAIAIQRIPTRVGEWDRYIEWFIWTLGTLAAFMAAWSWLSDETDGNPWPYLEEVVILAGVIVIVGLVALGTGAVGGMLFGKRERKE